MDWPRYRDLPTTPDGKHRCAWGVFGERDEAGTLNWITPERVAAAIAEVKVGERISLSLPVTSPDPPVSGGQTTRSVVTRHVVSIMDGRSLDEWVDGLWLQGSSQWDGLSHARHRDYGYYNGFQDREVGDAPGAHLGVDAWKTGIVARGLLLDFPRAWLRQGLDWSTAEPLAIGPAEIIAACEVQHLDLRPGDVLMLRTGWLADYLGASREKRERLANEPFGPGLHPTDETIEFLWDHQIPAIVADNVAVEVTPPQGTGFGHWKLIPLFGFALGELWWLDDLADQCAADGRWSCLLVSIPINLPGGTGSPANAIAIK